VTELTTSGFIFMDSAEYRRRQQRDYVNSRSAARLHDCDVMVRRGILCLNTIRRPRKR